MQRYFEIQQALIDAKGVIWDDHNGGFESKLHGLAALVNGDKVIAVGLHDSDYFSLNRVYLKDGKVHLSRDSVGGVLFPVNHKDLWECVNDYNEKQRGNKFSCGTLENVLSLFPIPVTVITMDTEENRQQRMKLMVTLTTSPQATLEDLMDNQMITRPGPEQANKRIHSLNVDYLNPEDEMAQDAHDRILVANAQDTRRDILEKVVGGEVSIKGSLLPEAQNPTLKL